MSMDRTLKVHGGLLRTRSVLTRAERIKRLVDEEKFDPEKDSPLGLPKVRVRRSRAGTKGKKAAKNETTEDGKAAEAQTDSAQDADNTAQ